MLICKSFKIHIGIKLISQTATCVFTLIFLIVQRVDRAVFINKSFVQSSAVVQCTNNSRNVQCFCSRSKFGNLLKVILTFCSDGNYHIGKIPSDLFNHFPASFSYSHFPYKLILSHFMTVCKQKNY